MSVHVLLDRGATTGQLVLHDEPVEETQELCFFQFEHGAKSLLDGPGNGSVEARLHDELDDCLFERNASFEEVGGGHVCVPSGCRSIPSPESMNLPNA